MKHDYCLPGVWPDLVRTSTPSAKVPRSRTNSIMRNATSILVAPGVTNSRGASDITPFQQTTLPSRQIVMQLFMSLTAPPNNLGINLLGLVMAHHAHLACIPWYPAPRTSCHKPWRQGRVARRNVTGNGLNRQTGQRQCRVYVTTILLSVLVLPHAVRSGEQRNCEAVVWPSGLRSFYVLGGCLSPSALIALGPGRCCSAPRVPPTFPACAYSNYSNYSLPPDTRSVD